MFDALIGPIAQLVERCLCKSTFFLFLKEKKLDVSKKEKFLKYFKNKIIGIFKKSNQAEATGSRPVRSIPSFLFLLRREKEPNKTKGFIGPIKFKRILFGNMGLSKEKEKTK